MMLCLDIGNSQIHGGIFKGDQLLFQFRRSSKSSSSSDELGVFLRSVLRENDVDPEDIDKISVCTVVPEVLHSLKNACLKYFLKAPFVLQAGVKTGLNIKYRNPIELGADRIANAIAASHIYPNENIILIDMGTATTFCALSANREFLGGAIIPGIKISMTALELNTSKLPTVEILPMTQALARSTVEGIQAGLYFGAIGSIREITARIRQEAFPNQNVRLIGTGGIASMFSTSKVFDQEIPDLILKGLYLAFMMNCPAEGRQNAAHITQI
jgi:type III pantothenate kinase